MANDFLISSEGGRLKFTSASIRVLLECPPDELSVIVDWVEREVITLSLEDCAKRVRQYAQHQGAVLSNAEAVLRALFSLEGVRVFLDCTGTELLEQLFSTLAAEEESQAQGVPTDQFAKTMERFFGQSRKLEQTLQAQRVYEGGSSHFVSCSSRAEFRPVFNQVTQQVEGGLICATLTIDVGRSGGEDEVESLSFQVDGTDLKAISNELEKLQGRLKSLRSLMGEKVPFLNPPFTGESSI